MDWLADNWQWLVLVALVAAGRIALRAHVRRRDVAMIRRLWSGLPRARRQEILYVRERIDRTGDSHLRDYDRVPEETLEEWFENSLSNSLDGEPWAFELLKEQVLSHNHVEGMRGMYKASQSREAQRPASTDRA